MTAQHTSAVSLSRHRLTPKKYAGMRCAVGDCKKPVNHAGFCAHHYERNLKYGTPNWPHRKSPNGAGTITQGYRRFRNKAGDRYEHTIVAERALGKPLPPGACVHHINEDRLDNRPENLVICPSNFYHKLLHVRMRALAGCGHADWIKCSYCGKWDHPQALAPRRTNGSRTHAKCQREYSRKRKMK